MLRMTQAVYEHIIQHAREGLPYEVCGYLGMHDGVAVSAYLMVNTDKSGEHFSMDPKEQFSVVRTMRTRDEQPGVVYHSHPATPSRPSAEDIRLAFDPKVSYLIVSLADTVPVVKSFRIENGRVSQEAIAIQP